jgi:predicted RNA-binding Zn-ribbon protein involved in translation (DUF1610 family)
MFNKNFQVSISAGYFARVIESVIPGLQKIADDLKKVKFKYCETCGGKMLMELKEKNNVVILTCQDCGEGFAYRIEEYRAIMGDEVGKNNE